MADRIEPRPGTGSMSAHAPVTYHDEGDGSFSQAEAAHLRLYNATSLLWQRATVNNGTGGLEVHIVGGSSSGTQYTEGDTDASITGTAIMWEDGSDTLRSVSAGKPLPVNIVAGAGSGGTASTDDAAFAVASGSGTPIMGLADETSPDSVDEGDVGVVRMTLPRALHVNLRDATGAEVSVGGGTQYDEDTVSAAADKITMAGVVRKDTAATLVNTDGDRTQMQVDATGRLYVNASGVAVPITDNSGSLTVDNGGTFAVQADTELTTADLDTGAGTDTRAVIGVALAASGGAALLPGDATNGAFVNVKSSVAIPVTDNSGSLTVDNGGTFAVQDSEKVADDAAFTVGTTKVQPVGFLADESSTDSVDEGDVGAARMTLDRKVRVVPTPHTSGGWDLFMASSGDGSTALTGTVQAVKASAGQLGGWYIYNPNSSATYVIIYNTASGSVTVGTTNPKMVVCIPATSAANVEFVNGIAFDTAIAVAATTTGGGNTAPTTALESNFLFK